MELIKYRKTLDVHKNGIQFMLQGFETADNLSRSIEISLMASGDAVDLPLERLEALMYVTSPNATEPSINKCEIKDNKIVYDVLPIVEEGITTMQLKLIESSANGATRVLASPKFAVEVTKSGADDESAEQSTTFTALEDAMAKAKTVYDERFLRMELSSDCVFKAYYADGTTYETDLLKKLFVNGNVLLSESFARGGTGIRAGEDKDNSMYYSNVSKSEAANAKNIMENSKDILEEVRLRGVYTAFSVDFETGDVEYVSPSFEFKVNLETGELDAKGQTYTFEDEIGRCVVEWLEANNIVLSDLQKISKTHTKEIEDLKEDKADKDDVYTKENLYTKDEILSAKIKDGLGLNENATPKDVLEKLRTGKLGNDKLCSFIEIYYSPYAILSGYFGVSPNGEYIAQSSQGVLTLYKAEDMSIVGSIEHGYIGATRIEMDDNFGVLCCGATSQDGEKNDHYSYNNPTYRYVFFEFNDKGVNQVNVTGSYGRRLRAVNTHPVSKGTSGERYFYFITEEPYNSNNNNQDSASATVHKLDKSNKTISSIKTMICKGSRLIRDGDDVIIEYHNYNYLSGSNLSNYYNDMNMEVIRFKSDNTMDILMSLINLSNYQTSFISWNNGVIVDLESNRIVVSGYITNSSQLQVQVINFDGTISHTANFIYDYNIEQEFNKREVFDGRIGRINIDTLEIGELLCVYHGKTYITDGTTSNYARIITPAFSSYNTGEIIPTERNVICVGRVKNYNIPYLSSGAHKVNIGGWIDE